ncbi:MAG TPA: tRNA pseudouridine(55) synthase TruB [Candidatus Saccharibacteria bacterium]|nr:tRNA pseudouridine(55) synthase TruB [Candidatus Saccharibacteria bacterium]
MIFDPGIYLVNKPRGRSSFSMVAQVRRLSGIKKVGHAGTLDPQAEGLLIVLVGKEYTKQSDKFLKLDKTYEFEIKLGQNSTTGDEEGIKTTISAQKPTKKAILSTIETFEGEIDQVPPQHSAIKIDGVRAYKSARKGEKVDIQPRKVTIDSLKLLYYNYPLVTLEADVSSGTYIRSLAEDIGKDLQTGGYCTKIVRTRIGEYCLKNAITLD